MKHPAIVPALVLLGFTLACGSGDEVPPPVGSETTAQVTPPTPELVKHEQLGDAAPTVAEAKATEVVPTDGHGEPLFPDRALTKADLEGKSLRELSIMRNTPYARRGHPFGKAWLDQYFSSYDAYDKRTHVSFGQLSEQEQANTKLIAQYVSKLPQKDLRERKDEILTEKMEWDHIGRSAEIELQLLSAALGEWAGDPKVPLSKRSPLEDPNTLKNKLTDEQVQYYTRAEFRLVRNTIFARHGRAFKSEILQDYFASKVWYQVDPDYADARLTDVDRENTDFILRAEKEHGGPMSDEEHGEWLAMLAGA